MPGGERWGMDEEERWRRAADSDDRFLIFRRFRPAVAVVAVAGVAAFTMALFLAASELGLGAGWLAALIAIMAMSLVGAGVAHLSNRQAKARYIAEYRRLNNFDPASGAQQTKSE
jgi:ribose/xylose/arabinose/galactoside ABC-type transport system permease subunit